MDHHNPYEQKLEKLKSQIDESQNILKITDYKLLELCKVKPPRRNAKRRHRLAIQKKNLLEHSLSLQKELCNLKKRLEKVKKLFIDRENQIMRYFESYYLGYLAERRAYTGRW